MKDEILSAIEFFKHQYEYIALNQSQHAKKWQLKFNELAIVALEEQLDSIEGSKRVSVGVGITSRIICSKCEKQVFNEKYCPNCGRKLTND